MGFGVVVVVGHEGDNIVFASLHRLVALSLKGQEAWVVLDWLLNCVVINVEYADVTEDAYLTFSLTDATHDGYLRSVQSGHGAEPFRDEDCVDQIKALPLSDLADRQTGI